MKCFLSILLDDRTIYCRTIEMPIAPFVGLDVQFEKYTMTLRYVKYMHKEKMIAATCDVDAAREKRLKKWSAPAISKILVEDGWEREY